MQHHNVNSNIIVYMALQCACQHHNVHSSIIPYSSIRCAWGHFSEHNNIKVYTKHHTVSGSIKMSISRLMPLLITVLRLLCGGYCGLSSKHAIGFGTTDLSETFLLGPALLALEDSKHWHDSPGMLHKVSTKPTNICRQGRRLRMQPCWLTTPAQKLRAGALLANRPLSSSAHLSKPLPTLSGSMHSLLPSSSKAGRGGDYRAGPTHPNSAPLTARHYDHSCQVPCSSMTSSRREHPTCLANTGIDIMLVPCSVLTQTMMMTVLLMVLCQHLANTAIGKAQVLC